MYKSSDYFYNRFSFLYPIVDIFLKPQKKVLFREINKLEDGKLLEIGVGNGSHFRLYKKHRIIGIDTSPAMLKIAGSNTHENITVFKMDGTSLLFDDNEFDYVVLSHVIAVVDNPGQLLNEVYRVLKPHGQLFILNHFTPDNWLKQIDLACASIAKVLRFKSVFRIRDMVTIDKFVLLKEFHLGIASYFKLLIYQKN